jgi:hypothetical protein
MGKTSASRIERRPVAIIAVLARIFLEMLRTEHVAE